MIHTHELQHLVTGPEPGETPEGIGLVRFDIRCDGDASGVLGRMRDVLGVVAGQRGVGWPALDEWRRHLPAWFVAACAPEMTSAEADESLARWQQLSPAEQQREEEQRAWSLGDWLYWFEPAQRTWYWWDATVESDQHARIAIAVESWPFPWGALKWLARAAGAQAIEPEE
ncbi:MAG: hypothetical protein ACYC7A_04830 [Thermoanaerobaculia bacterium]